VLLPKCRQALGLESANEEAPHRRFKMSESKVIYEFRKNAGQKIVCQFTEFKGRKWPGPGQRREWK
jgi:hypothetical protein